MGWGGLMRLATAAVQILPAVGQEFVEPVLLPPNGQLPEHIGKIWQRRHSVLGTGTHQAIERSGSAGSIVRTREQVVLTPQSDVC